VNFLNSVIFQALDLWNPSEYIYYAHYKNEKTIKYLVAHDIQQNECQINCHDFLFYKYECLQS